MKDQVTKFKAVDDLRDRLSQLHAERGAAVAEAKDFRHGHGVTSASFKSAWNVVEKLTGQIEQAERELDAAMREAAVCIMPTSVICDMMMALDEIRQLPRFDDRANLKEQLTKAQEISRRAIKSFEANEDEKRREVCQAVLADMDKEDQQTVINRLREGLELIAEMPVVDPALNIPLASVVSQYDEARETARLTLDQYARNGGIVADRAALDEDRTPSITTKREVPNG